MCRTVYVSQNEGNDLVINTVGELRAALGVAPVVRDGYHGPLREDGCLCACDVKATAKAAHFDVRDEQWDGWTLTPNNQAHLRERSAAK